MKNIERNTDPTMDLLTAIDLGDDIGCTAVKLEAMVSALYDYFDGPATKEAVLGISLEFDRIRTLLEISTDYVDSLKKQQGDLAQTLDLLR